MLSGSPAILGLTPGRPMTLRPPLSRGLPFTDKQLGATIHGPGSEEMKRTARIVLLIIAWKEKTRAKLVSPEIAKSVC